MLIRKFILKVTNNERKILIHHKIIDCTAERTVLVITQQCIESKLCLDLNLRRSNFSFTYSFKFTYCCIVYIYIWTLKSNFVQKIKKPLIVIKTTAKHKNLLQQYILTSSSYFHKGRLYSV